MTSNRSLPALALACALALTGCGADEGGQETKDVSSESSSTTPSASSDASATSAVGEAVDVAAFVADFEAGFRAATTYRMVMDLTIAGQAMTAQGEVDYSGNTPAMAMTLSGGMAGGEGMELRLLDDIMYVKMPGAGGKFLAMDLTDEANLPPGMGGMLDQLDPNKTFAEFSKGLTAVSLLGEEEVDGVATRHYRLTIDPAKVESLRDPAIAGAMPKSLQTEVWLDDDNLMRQMKLDIPNSGGITARMSGYGEPVTIEKPAPNQIQPMPRS